MNCGALILSASLTIRYALCCFWIAYRCVFCCHLLYIRHIFLVHSFQFDCFIHTTLMLTRKYAPTSIHINIDCHTKKSESILNRNLNYTIESDANCEKINMQTCMVYICVESFFSLSLLSLPISFYPLLRWYVYAYYSKDIDLIRFECVCSISKKTEIRLSRFRREKANERDELDRSANLWSSNEIYVIHFYSPSSLSQDRDKSIFKRFNQGNSLHLAKIKM